MDLSPLCVESEESKGKNNNTKKKTRTCLYSCGATFGVLLVLFAVYIIILKVNESRYQPLMCGVIDYVNNRPIIGILSQEATYLNTKFPKENYTSYIAASYVKQVEASGAIVVPIMIGKERSYYRDLMEKINGVLLPGGATSFKARNGYADAGQHIFEIAKEMNNYGDYFPIFGVCLGFELLIVLDSGRGSPQIRVNCSSHDSESLQFTDDYHTSKMFSDAPKEVIHSLENDRVTVNAHSYCILDENLRSHNLTEHWQATSHSNDANGIKFIATIEHKSYPFYGVQFHPEKSAFEWKPDKHYPRSAEAIMANRFFIDFFLSECRRNHHHFDLTEEGKYVIYNYEPHFTGALGSAYEQSYLFEPRSKP